MSIKRDYLNDDNIFVSSIISTAEAFLTSLKLLIYFKFSVRTQLFSRENDSSVAIIIYTTILVDESMIMIVL